MFKLIHFLIGVIVIVGTEVLGLGAFGFCNEDDFGWSDDNSVSSASDLTDPSDDFNIIEVIIGATLIAGAGLLLGLLGFGFFNDKDSTDGTGGADSTDGTGGADSTDGTDGASVLPDATGTSRNVAHCDAATNWQFGFQEPATFHMEGIINFHNDVMFSFFTLFM